MLSFVMPIACAVAITLSYPTLVARRTNAQLTECAVARSRVCSPFSLPSAELLGYCSGGTAGNTLGTGQGSSPDTTSSGE